MSQVFLSVGMSLDGFLAGPNRGPTNPLGDGGTSIHAWIYQQRTFRQNLGLVDGDGGETGADDRFLAETLARAGATIMGKRMFEEGERNWPEDAPFHTPVFVLTHERRSPWERKGGTTFYFVDDGIASALRQARAVAGGKDIRIAGGADAIAQYLEAGAIDELTISLAPVVLGEGLPLFKPGQRLDGLRIVEVIHSPRVTHLRYTLR